MATNLKVTELDFDEIKDNLKAFLKTQTEFNDYDFDGSGMSVLLDVLAYNTHYNAMNAHFALNEAFLDSAQIRGNVVTRAKLLGYIPRSILAPRATVTIAVNVAGESGTIPTTLTLSRGTKLKTLVGGEEFQYVVLDNHTTTISNNVFTFSNVTICEGSFREIKYRVDNDIENQKFQLTSDTADTSTLRIRVQENEESTAFDIYTKFETLSSVNSETKTYYLQQNSNEYYEVYFGDGVTGFKPTNNNIVTIDYVTTKGKESNGAGVALNSTAGFSMVDNIGGFSTITVTTSALSTGGVDPETSESIRFNAPLTFTSQNRAVTADDYAAIIKKSFSNIDSISTWGGEDQDPPEYGKAYIAIKPLLSDKLTDNEKSEITGTILKGKNVVSITPEIVDPNFTNLELDVFFKYNPNLTDRSSTDLQTVVRDTIKDYNFNNLNKFDGVFRHSELARNIDGCDPSILNSTIRPRMFQTITPISTGLNNFDLSFTSPFFQTGSSTNFILTSTAFKINGEDHFFGDIPVTGSNSRQVIVYKIVSGANVTTINNAGTVDVSNGKVILNSFQPDDTTAIRITVVPNSLDLAPKRDQLLTIDDLRVIINPEIDTIAVSGSSGSIGYSTTSRIK